MSMFNELEFVRREVRSIPGYATEPSRLEAAKFFLSRITKAVKHTIADPEILLFALLQCVVIGLGYYLWVQMLGWIPEEVWRSASNSDSGSIADIVLLAWTFFVVGLVTYPLGILSACIGASHFLRRTGQVSTFAMCTEMVLTRATGALWTYSWLDGWITVRQIFKRLPKTRDWPPSGVSESLYYTWKIGTIGLLPALVTGKNLVDAGKESIAFLKEKFVDATLLRLGYSILCWVVGIGAYIGTIFFFIYFDTLLPDNAEVYSYIFTFYLWVGVPLIISSSIVLLVIRPIYLLALFDLYADYLNEHNQPLTLPPPVSRAENAFVIFIALALGIMTVFLFRDTLGITALLSVPYI